MKCANCMHFELINDRKLIRREAEIDSYGYHDCRRYPPKLVKNSLVGSEWPKVTQNDWCGEWSLYE